ncbi:MAG: Xaa-Pro peptidase family protein [Peptococcaceae bacterium]|nr:Xaa-Pro peptidase family protein [Peptococcaceae bacterium]
MLDRIGRLREIMAREGIDALLISRPENRYYLTGFTGTSGAVLLTGKEIYLITDFRYVEQAGEQSPHCKVFLAEGTLPEALALLDADLNFHCLGCEGDFITYQQFSSLADKFRGREVRPLSGFVEQFRAVKDDREVRMIEEAVRISDMALDHILPFVREGVSERELALEIEFFMRKMGAEGVAFPLIVASGHRSAMPHGTASEKRLKPGEFLIMDFGAVLNGYCSDITRTVAVSRADKKMEDIYGIVLEAQRAGIDAVREGVTASAVDGAVREVIRGYGYGDRFGHSAGHGLGLQIHEIPRLSSRDDTVLKKGMVITVEPGIYLQGWGGVRIEDTVVVEEKGCRVLSASPKDGLIVCG